MVSDPRWIFLGSAPDCDVLVSSPMVARHHARCRLEGTGRVLLEDLGSPNGTAINQPGKRISTAFVNPTDIVYLGGFPVPAGGLFQALQAKPGAAPMAEAPPAVHGAAAQSLCAERGVTVIGRAPDASNKQQLILNHPMISRNHAGLLRTEQDEYYLWDLGSTYGTFLDGERVGSKRVRVLPQQTIGIAGYRFSLGAQGAVALVAPRSGFEIRADGLATEIGSIWRRRLNLEGVRLYVPPRTLLALMGPSGAGKTTLLRALAGQAPPKKGVVLYNDQSLYARFDALRPSIGYVPQDDIIHAQLTVKQALYYSARLRLPVDYSSSEILRRVQDTMNRLGIAGQADVIVGSAEKRGVSGGQRKRVNLAMELLADPAVLLLDEPTSGLSSSDAERVVTVLRSLADEGRTVIVSIHQPPLHVYQLFDELGFVDNDTVRTVSERGPQPGRVIYWGPGRSAPEFFRRHDPTRSSQSLQGADVVFEAIEKNPARTTADWEQAYQGSPEFHKHVAEPLSRPAPASPPASRRRNLPSPFHQLWTLLSRRYRIELADPWSMCQMLLLQPVLMACGIGLVAGTLATASSYSGLDYLKDFANIGKTLFFCVFTSIWFGCNNTAREIVGELAIYQRERMAGLSLSAYLGSKTLFFAGVCLIQCVLLLAVVSLFVVLKASFPLLLLICWLSAISGVALGLAISAFSPNSERAIQLIPLALLPMILFGGSMTRVSDFERELARNLSTVTSARWSFESALLAENARRPMTVQTSPAPPFNASPVPERFTLAHYFFEDSPATDRRIWRCLGTVCLFAVALLSIAGVFLRFKDVH